METWRLRRTLWGKYEEQRLARLRRELRRPGALLVLEHRGGHHCYRVVPGNIRLSDEEAAALIRRKYVVQRDPGLFSDTGQVWIAA
jgi:hypothetical protein